MDSLPNQLVTLHQPPRIEGGFVSYRPWRAAADTAADDTAAISVS